MATAGPALPEDGLAGSAPTRARVPGGGRPRAVVPVGRRPVLTHAVSWQPDASARGGRGTHVSLETVLVKLGFRQDVGARPATRHPPHHHLWEPRREHVCVSRTWRVAE